MILLPRDLMVCHESLHSLNVRTNTGTILYLTLTGPRDESVHAICHNPSDEFHFTGNDISRPVRLKFPICRPSKASRQTLANSGTFLGLSPPSESLARLSSPSLLDQLLDQGILSHKSWSVTLLDTETGILSLGGTIAREVEETKIRVETELKHFGESVATSEWVSAQVEEQMKLAMPVDSAWDEHFKWTDVQGAAGWWTALMAGVWINGAKVRLLIPIDAFLLNKNINTGSQKPANSLRPQCAPDPGTPSRSPALLRIHRRHQTPSGPLRRLLRLPVPQPRQHRFRDRRLEFPDHGWRRHGFGYPVRSLGR